MKKNNRQFFICIFWFWFLHNPINLLAMDNFGQQQQKELNELGKKLFKAVKENRLNIIEELIGEQSPLSESYRAELFEMRSKRKKETLLQKAYPKRVPFDCTNGEGCPYHRTAFICGPRFIKLLELGANIKDIPLKDLLVCADKLTQEALKNNNSTYLKALFSHSSEFSQIILEKTDRGNTLLKNAAKLGNTASFELLLEQENVNIMEVREIAEQHQRPIIAIMEKWIKEKKIIEFSGKLIPSIRAKSLQGIINNLNKIVDENIRIKEANAGLLYAYTLWLNINDAKSDIIMTKIITTLIKEGATLKQFSENQLCGTNKYRRYTLLHSAAHMGGIPGELLAQSILSHASNAGKRLIASKSEDGESPLQLAQNYRSQKVVDAILKYKKERIKGEEFSFSQQSLDLL